MPAGTSELGKALTAIWRSPGVKFPCHVTRWRLIFDHDALPAVPAMWARVLARALGRTGQGDWFWLAEWHEKRWHLTPFRGKELVPLRRWRVLQASRLRRRRSQSLGGNRGR